MPLRELPQSPPPQQLVRYERKQLDTVNMGKLIGISDLSVLYRR